MRRTPACAPAVEAERIEAAEVRPLSQVRLPENHRAGAPQPVDHHRVGWDSTVDQRERTRRRLHGVSGGDVVLHQHRNTVEGAPDQSAAPFVIETGGD